MPQPPAAPRADRPTPDMAQADSRYRAFLEDLIRRGIPQNTARAYESDRRYIAAWKMLSLGAGLVFPEEAGVVRRFVLEHSRGLEHIGDDLAMREARRTAEAMIDAGLRRSLAAPSAATLDRRIAGWRALHGWRGMEGPFDQPGLRRDLRLARRALARDAGARAAKSATPITADLLDEMMRACGGGLRGLRDRAILATGFDSGGRRRSELAALRVEDLDLSEFDSDGRVWLRLLETKTQKDGRAPRLLLTRPGAGDLVAWLDAAGIESGPVFRRIARGKRGLEEFGKVQEKGLSGAAINQIVKRLLAATGRDPASASAHGLRSGFLTEAARQGAPLQAAMRLSLHRSVQQAAQYYRDAELTENPAIGLRGRRGAAP